MKSKKRAVYRNDAPSSAVATTSSATNLPVAKYDDKTFEAAANSGAFLPRLQLMTSNSEKCKSGEFPINHFARVSDSDFIDLGTEIDLVILAFRPKALKMGDEVISCYDVDSELYKKIQEQSGVKDSGCMYGPEFLVWIPARKEFMTFFMGSTSGRRESKSFYNRKGLVTTSKPARVETAKYTWYTAKAFPCTTPVEMPEAEALKAQIAKFENPPAQEIEPGERKSERET